ncbi:MAG: 7,8-didemethyl-8-hydroxy-5-deazariboflavin synthase subunit CofH [Candidatus Methylomirabilis sp.]|nr:7,8-didemethyl-8-hydroxy-5-deazariboflavin synthase subunit CofH [Candidatus Methylomirabilis sp.]
MLASRVNPDDPGTDDQDLTRTLDRIERDVARLLEGVLEGRELSVDGGVRLALAQGPELRALVMTADAMRQCQVGDVVTYVVNRNINFTNICIKRCAFCAFSRNPHDASAYSAPRRDCAKDAGGLGAWRYRGLRARRLTAATGRPVLYRVMPYHQTGGTSDPPPRLSPEEILYGSRQSGIPIAPYLSALKEAGLDTLPGTAAEILDDEIRDIISHGRISTRQWIDVVTTAHALGIRTSATMMYGHIEQPIHWIRHMALLRDIQKATGGFTEFVPLSLVHHEAPIWRYRVVQGVRQGATRTEVVKAHALARLMLGATFRNIQASWVKEGPRFAQYLLTAGANDVGGTLMNESISMSAGARYGEFMLPAALRRLIREIGRAPAQRSTTYQCLRRYDDVDEAVDPLDRLADPEARFGSYRTLIASHAFRYERMRRGCRV